MKKLLFVFALLCLLAACGQPRQAPATTTEENPLVTQTFSVFETQKVPSLFPDHWFGHSVGIDGDLMVVGEPLLKKRGAAYILQRDGSGVWKIVMVLFADDSASIGEFGSAVSISGDTVVVGARNCYGGAAYIFQRNQGGSNQWGQVKKIGADDGSCSSFSAFGRSVDIAGDTVVVGALDKAFIFERHAGGTNAWGQTKQIQPKSFSASFGSSVSVSFDTVVVGEPDDNTAHVFLRNQGGAGNWGAVQRLFPKVTIQDSGSGFGDAVAVSGNTIVVGSPLQDIDINVNGTLECSGTFDDSECYVGAAYVFERNQDGREAWGQVKELVASDLPRAKVFGISVAIWGDLLVVGTWYGDTAYVFERSKYDLKDWWEVKKLEASDGNDDFGRAVSISGSRVVVGAEYKGEAVYIYE